MLSNAYFLAKFRFDTAENEPAKNLQNFAKKIANLPILLLASPSNQSSRDEVGGVVGARCAGVRQADLGSRSAVVRFLEPSRSVCTKCLPIFFLYFGGLVLGCIEADVCRASLLLLLLRTSSWGRYTHFCTIRNSKFSQQLKICSAIVIV